MISSRELLLIAYALIPSSLGTAASKSDGRCLLQTAKVPTTDAPLVSVIMPVHNTVGFLNDSTGTVMNQTLGSWELVLVDVSSSDGSLQLENLIAAQHPQVKVVRLESQPLGGAGIPSNIGMSVASGKYIAFLDPDDRFDVTFLEKMVQTAEASTADVVVCNAARFSADSAGVTQLDSGQLWRRLPKNIPLSLQAHPQDYAKLFLLNAGPWRKLYSRQFLDRTGTRWTEGDFFYEDNRFHWSTLLSAKDVVVKNETLVFHRTGRKGQSTNVKGSLGARTARWATLMMHMQAVGTELSQRASLPPALWKAFFEKLGVAYHVARRNAQHNGKYGAKLNSTLTMLIDRFLPISQMNVSEMLNASKHFSDVVGKRMEHKIDLSIVVPVHKVPLDIEKKMDDLFNNFKLRFEVFFVYDRIGNDSMELLQKLENAYDNVFVFESGAPNAGRARNTAYPLLLGDFTFFFDADDSINFRALDQAVREAKSRGSDVMLLRYNISRPQPSSGQIAIKGMIGGDTAIWRSMMDRTHNVTQDLAVTQQLSKLSALRLINYPWKQLTRTRLLQNKAVFFGPNNVHNDVQFHWHSLVVANRIDFSKGHPVCTHLKSGITGASLTEVRSSSRLEVVEALKWTHRVLDREGFIGRWMPSDSLQPLQNENRKLWFGFVKKLLNWNRGRIPPETLTEFSSRRKQLLRSMGIDDDEHDDADGIA